MQDDSRVALVERFFSGTGLSYDQIVNLCTIGFDVWWKRRILGEIPGRPEGVLDQACGTGILTFKIARRFPGCRVIGVELCREYLAIAREKASKSNLNEVRFIEGRAEDVVLREKLDCITSSYLAKYAELGVLIRNAAAMLRAGGVLIIHDFTYPTSLAARRLLSLHFMALQTIGGRIWPQWRAAFYELPHLIQHSRWVPDLIGALRKNGFSKIRIESLTLGISAIVTATKN